jgi:hypothetical protein
MNSTIRKQRGFMMIEALVAMTLILTAASCTMWFLHRALRGVALQRIQQDPQCDRPTCGSGMAFSECRCGTQTFRAQR